MTKKAQAEAERIVGGLVACGVSTDETRLREYGERHKAVVAALAAAIEVWRARMDRDAQKARPVEEAMQRNIEAHEELERALSALWEHE